MLVTLYGGGFEVRKTKKGRIWISGTFADPGFVVANFQTHRAIGIKVIRHA